MGFRGGGDCVQMRRVGLCPGVVFFACYIVVWCVRSLLWWSACTKLHLDLKRSEFSYGWLIFRSFFLAMCLRLMLSRNGGCISLERSRSPKGLAFLFSICFLLVNLRNLRSLDLSCMHNYDLFLAICFLFWLLFKY